MVLIGLGSAGDAVVQAFSTHHKKISITSIDFPDVCIHEEDYEKHCPKFKKKLSFKEDECLFVLCGASMCSSAALRILETIKNKKVNILYICPDPNLSGSTRLKRHKVVFNVLQEYTRSGLLNSMCIVSNKQILNIIGDQSITNMYDNINKTIAHTFESVGWFTEQPPIMGSLHSMKKISRIYTVSIGNIEKNEQNMLFLLDNPTETWYIYSISQKELDNDRSLLPKIRERVLTDEEKGINSSFGIYSSQHDQSYSYSVSKTHFIQPMETK
jgi:hypothetical protein